MIQISVIRQRSSDDLIIAWRLWLKILYPVSKVPRIMIKWSPSKLTVSRNQCKLKTCLICLTYQTSQLNITAHSVSFIHFPLWPWQWLGAVAAASAQYHERRLYRISVSPENDQNSSAVSTECISCSHHHKVEKS